MQKVEISKNYNNIRSLGLHAFSNNVNPYFLGCSSLWGAWCSVVCLCCTSLHSAHNTRKHPISPSARGINCVALMSWSKIAFGSARCAKGVAEHEAALTRALQRGITGKCTKMYEHSNCCTTIVVVYREYEYSSQVRFLTSHVGDIFCSTVAAVDGNRVLNSAVVLHGCVTCDELVPAGCLFSVLFQDSSHAHTPTVVTTI